VIVKTMDQPATCKGCEQAHTCAKVHEQLGRADGPSVTLEAMVAFLLPLAAFAGTLAVWCLLLQGTVAPRYETPLGCAIALATTTVLMSAVSTAIKRRHRACKTRNG